MKKIKNIISAVLALSFIMSAVFTNVSFAADTDIRKASLPVAIDVGKEENFKFHSIQDALDSINVIPTEKNPAIITISKGIYEESINVDIPNVIFKIPEANKAGDVIITYDKAAVHADDKTKSAGTQGSATVTLTAKAKGFKAYDIVFQNSYNLNQPELGKDNGRAQTQAVALVSLADKVVFDNCRFIGRQDTLYLKGASKGKDVFGEANPARVYLKDCYIEGTVDFIFGDATAFFDNCKLNLAYYSNGGHFTAANTTLFNIGFVFSNCELTVDSKYNQEDSSKIDLGRPWQGDDQYPNYGSHTVFINCKMPSIMKTDGFSVWNDSTVKNKIRYMEYGSYDESRKSINLSNRPDWVKVLNDEQAAAYNVYNILRGNDYWNPLEDSNRNTPVKAADITLNKYNIEIPKGETQTIKATVVPLNADNKNVQWSSSDEKVAIVDENGNITALSEGKTKIAAVTEDGGFSSFAYLNVSAPRTDIPQISEISIGHKDEIYPGETVSADYSYILKSDNEIDCALLRWYFVNDETGAEILVKEGHKDYAGTYTVSNADIGGRLKLSVIPETLTTYGTKGAAVSYITDVTVSEPNKDIPKVYLREDFSNYKKLWKESNSGNDDNSWEIVDNNGDSMLGIAEHSGKEYSLLEYSGNDSKKWNNISLTARMRFNPENTGFSSDSYYDIYTAYDGKDNSYYKFRIVRGNNGNSVKFYLYKKADKNTDEILLASDEDSGKNNMPQNSGEKNPWFVVSQTIINGEITVSVKLEEQNKEILKMYVKDTESLDGFAAVECLSGRSAVLLDLLTIEQVFTENDKSDRVRIYLAGDSTVKSYGDDNTIGGWGEYLPYYFNSDDVEIINKAEGGRSTRSYINEGRLDDILKDIREGDYLFIQFGHNDGLTTENARVQHSVALGEPDENGNYPTIPSIKTNTPDWIYNFYEKTDFPYKKTFYPYESGTYKWFLSQYINGAKEKGAIPVLITPVSRVFFDENGKITPHHGENDGYVKAVLQLADEMDVAYVDMFDITKEMYENYGTRVTQGLQNIKQDGTMDITHYNKFGSNIVTSLLIKALAEQNIGIAEEAVASSKFVSRTEDMKTANLYLIGDSTVAENEFDIDDMYSVKPEGWGKYLQKYFDEKINVVNLAYNSATAKSFIKSENYETFINTFAEGDYVMIQFGLNDSIKETDDDILDRYSAPSGDKEKKGSFENYLYEYYIKPVTDKKAVPILVTPPSVRLFDSQGNASESGKDYTDSVRQLAADLQIPFINLNDATFSLYNDLGVENSKSLHAMYIDALNGDNGVDNYNYNSFGAEKIAKLILQNMQYSSVTLRNYINESALNAEDDNYILRGDFVTGLINVINVKTEADNNFVDVPKGKTYTSAFATANLLGIVEADYNGYVYPEEKLKGYDLKQFISKSLAYEMKLNNTDLSILDSINDDEFVTKENAYLVLNWFYETINNIA